MRRIRVLPGDGPLMACPCGVNTRDPLTHLRTHHPDFTLDDIWTTMHLLAGTRGKHHTEPRPRAATGQPMLPFPA